MNCKRYHIQAGGEYYRARFYFLRRGVLVMIMDWNRMLDAVEAKSVVAHSAYGRLIVILLAKVSDQVLADHPAQCVF